MNNGSYKIVISLSHHRIAFEYWQRDGEDKLTPVGNRQWPVALAFYCSPLGIEIGDVAVRAANAGTTNAFEDYFDRLASNEKYTLGGRQKELRYLLLDAAEAMFEEFFRSNLYGRIGTLSDNRATMPLTLVCEPDINSDQRSLVASLFRDSGYHRFKQEEYNKFIEDYLRSSLSRDYPDCKYSLVVWTEGSALTFTLVDLKGKEKRRTAVYPGLGIDPRLDYVKQKIWQRITGQNPWLAYRDEEETIQDAAASFLASSDPLFNGSLVLSDGNTYYYSLNRTEIDNLQCDEGAEIRKHLETFLAENGAENRGEVLLILRGLASGNIFFEKTICPGFTNIKRSDRKLRDNVMQLLIADPNPGSPVEGFTSTPWPEPAPGPEPKPEPEPTPELTPEPEGKDKNKPEINKEPKHGENKTDPYKNSDGIQPPPVPPTPPPFNPQPDPEELKKLQREWRSVKAEAKGKKSVGKMAEAVSIIREFVDKAKEANATNLINEANVVLAEYEATSAAQPKKPDGYSGKGKNPGHGGESKSPREEKPASKPSTEKKVDEGKQLIHAGKLKEARDWYRSQGRSSLAKPISDVIRAQRSVDTRRLELATHQKNGDASKIAVIIKEIEDFIALCDKIEYPSDSYRQLLSDYKKIRTK